MTCLLAFAVLLAGAADAQTSLSELLSKVAKWDYHDSRESLLAVSEIVAKTRGPEDRREIEKRFIAFLQSDATAAGKDFICRQLSTMGSEASAPVLSGMLLDPKTAEIARYALERIPGPAVNSALRSGLGKTSGRTRIGVINSLGRRRDAQAVAALRPLALDGDPLTAGAALWALAEIADPAAVNALQDALGKTAGASEACLKAADQLTMRGRAAEALPIYKRLYAVGQPAAVRAGALRGLARDPQSAPVLLEALRGSDARLQAVAIRYLDPGRLIAEMPKLGDAGQVRVIAALAGRGDAAGRSAITAALKSPSQPVRVAAIDGLARMGNASVVSELAAIAGGGDETEQAAARAGLGRMPGKDVDQAVVEGIRGSAGKLRLELIRAAGERGTAAAAPLLLGLARDPSDEVRRESLRALRDTGSSGDVSALAGLVANPANPDDRTEAVRSVVAVLRRSEPGRIGEVVAAYTSAGGGEARAALMQVMGQSGNPQVLDILRSALKEGDVNGKRSAILALTDWPDAAPVTDLLEVARTAGDPVHQVLALRGALRLIGLPAPGRPAAESVKMLAEALRLASRPEEKRTVLGLLPRFPTAQSLELARGKLGDSEVTAEAKEAVTRLERSVRRQAQ